MSRQFLTYSLVVTAAVHAGLAIAIASIDEQVPRPPTTITIREVKRPAPPAPAPAPPPPTVAAAPTPPHPTPAPTPAPPKPAPRVAPAAAPPPATPPPPASAAPATPPGPASYGVRLDNGAGGKGPAVPSPSGGSNETAPPAPLRKTLGAAETTGGCTDAPTKPKPIEVVQPAFTQEAQDAGITGKVRVEITISKTGEVINARVLAGLGYGLDEVALAAAKASTFAPATKCGDAVETTFTIGMRFQR